MKFSGWNSESAEGTEQFGFSLNSDFRADVVMQKRIESVLFVLRTFPCVFPFSISQTLVRPFSSQTAHAFFFAHFIFPPCVSAKLGPWATCTNLLPSVILLADIFLITSTPCWANGIRFPWVGTSRFYTSRATARTDFLPKAARLANHFYIFTPKLFTTPRTDRRVIERGMSPARKTSLGRSSGVCACCMKNKYKQR